MGDELREFVSRLEAMWQPGAYGGHDGEESTMEKTGTMYRAPTEQRITRGGKSTARIHRAKTARWRRGWLCHRTMRIGNRGHDGFFVGSGSGIEGSQAGGDGEPSQGKEAAAGAAVEVAAEVAPVDVVTGVSLAGVVSSSSEAVGSVMPARLSASMAGRVRSWRLLM